MQERTLLSGAEKVKRYHVRTVGKHPPDSSSKEEGIDWEEDCYDKDNYVRQKKKDKDIDQQANPETGESSLSGWESMRHDIEFRQSNRSADFIQGIEEEDSDDRFINRGRMLHTLFSVIETAEDIDPAIERLIFEGVIRNDEKEKVAREVATKAFSSPEIQDWYSESGHYLMSVPLSIKKKGVLQTRRLDRVMMKDNRVVVVDFKFGKENPKYNKQVKGYMQLLTKMGYKNITGYLWYVDEEKIEKSMKAVPLIGIARHRLTIDGEGVTTLVAFHGCPLVANTVSTRHLCSLTVFGESYNCNQLYEEVRKDELYFLASCGGVTFGGGEPLLQSEFIRQFRQLCGPEWRITVETSLNVPQQNVRRTDFYYRQLHSRHQRYE